MKVVAACSLTRRARRKKLLFVLLPGTKTMRAFGVVALVLAVAVTQARGADEGTEKEHARFHGDWQMVAVTQDGSTVPADRLKDRIWTFKDDKLIPQYDRDDTATVKLNPTKRPAELDLIDKNGDTVEGIYKFDGADKLVICGRSDGKRPTEFAAGAKSGAILFMLERVKPKK